MKRCNGVSGLFFTPKSTKSPWFTRTFVLGYKIVAPIWLPQQDLNLRSTFVIINHFPLRLQTSTPYCLLDASRPPCDSRQFLACDSAFGSQVNYLLQYKKKKHRLVLLFIGLIGRNCNSPFARSATSLARAHIIAKHIICAKRNLVHLCRKNEEWCSRYARNDVDLRSNDVVPAAQMKKSKSKDLDIWVTPTILNL